MRWLLLGVGFLGFAIAFSTKSAGVLALGLLLGFGGLFLGLFAFASARIASTARPDSALLTDRDINALRASIRKPGAAAGNGTPPPAQN